ncbi:MAG: uroporphyrinogen-III synthase [Bacteroidia bacterium]|nr:uroporphyrinogen-III synthase [Bacteroidia bacterium]
MSEQVVNKPVTSILISQPAPSDSANSPYTRIADRWGIQIDFRKFIQVDGVSVNEFRKQGVNPLDFSAIILSSKVAVDHFFRLLEEMRIEMPPEMRYFCVGESTAKYLQKYIVIRKRKLHVGERRLMDLLPLIQKYKKEKYLFPCSDVTRNQLTGEIESLGIEVVESVMYRTVASDLSDLENIFYDMICFYSPTGIQSLYKNFPDFKQNNTRIAVFGKTTADEAELAGLRLDVVAPQPEQPSMTAAIEAYLKTTGQEMSQ